ncbi:MAG: AAA family ATPase [Verrucomicrobiae bacterium]|nr:AAA family ATPase [Verrucomicrobiae bacterium]
MKSLDPELLKRLEEADCYPSEPGDVQVIQTHLSVVCLAGDRVYKLKKPVKFAFADFSTRQLREQVCHDELCLNRRLCPEIYLGVVPLRKSDEGQYSFCEGAGQVVDHAVLMERLPDDRLMADVLAEGGVEASQVEEIAHKIAKFHTETEPDAATQDAGSPECQREAIVGNFAEMEGCAHVDRRLLEAVERRTRVGLDDLVAALECRARDGRVVDGHGDLHTRNIFLVAPPKIFDCIEFNKRFRCGDVATENAFLIMDLIYRGRRDLAEHYLGSYIADTGDQGQADLMPMLVSFRAMVRSKVAALAADDESVSAEERDGHARSASQHLRLAGAALLDQTPHLLVFCGLPATGKSTIARSLSEIAGWSHFSSDVVRKELAGAAPDEKLSERYYRRDFSDSTYERLIERACAAAEVAPAIADANFPSVERRRQLRRAANKRGCAVTFIWVRTDEHVVKQRLAERSGEDAHGSDADLSVYEDLKEKFEQPADGEGFDVIQLDGAALTSNSLDQVLCHLLR